MATMCRCGHQCRGACNMVFSDEQPGNVQRMEKTKHKQGVWAGARALIEHDEFPSLLEASKLRLGSLELNREQTKFQYAWRKWKGDLQALCERQRLPPSCERMVRVLHQVYEYDMSSMLGLSLQLARAVIELELRRSETGRGVPSPSSDTDCGNETSLMTKVRSAVKHKEQDVKKCIDQFIRKCYHLVARVAPPPPLQPPAPPNIDPIHAPDVSVTGYMQHQPGYTADWTDFMLNIPMVTDWENTNNCNQSLLFTPTSNVTLPTDDTNDHDHCNEIVSGEEVPGLTFNPIFVQGQNDPLFSVVQLCEQGEVVQAVTFYKSVIHCERQSTTSEMATADGLTPWYYMWLRLGEEIKRREEFAEKRGIPAKPKSSQILCALDPVFAELECDRDYGEFSPPAEETLNKAIENGNFAAMATKGLLMLGAESEVSGSYGYSSMIDDNDSIQADGLELVLKAMKVDQWTVPRFLVQLIKDRNINTNEGMVRKAVEEVRKRADKCSVLSFHLGTLLSYENAHEVGYSCNVAEAKNALESCMHGVFVCPEIRLQCTRKLGRLVTFGVGGLGVDLDMAERVLKKGVEAEDTYCIQHLANVKLRKREQEAAAELFLLLFSKDEWEVLISAKTDNSKPGWETYRIHVLEQYEANFLNDVRNGSCLPHTFQQNSVSRDYGELMLIEFHEYMP